MTPGELAGVIASFAALLGAGGWIANLGLNQIQRRKLEVETAKAEIDLGTARASNAKTIFFSAGELVESLRQELTRQAARIKEMDEGESRCREELNKALARIDVLEARARARDLAAGLLGGEARA